MTTSTVGSTLATAKLFVYFMLRLHKKTCRRASSMNDCSIKHVLFCKHSSSQLRRVNEVLHVCVSVPSSYMLVSDMDGVKMVSVDSSGDKSVYVVAVGRPFLSNFVALAHDPSSDTAYYSDVRRYAHFAHSERNKLRPN